MDGDKTVVKCSDNDVYSRYAGFCAAVVKKLYGGTRVAKKALDRMDTAMGMTVGEVIKALQTMDSTEIADILLGSMEDIPLKFYDPTLGAI